MANPLYNNLFTAQQNTTPELITNFVPWKVNMEMNDLFSAPFTDTEIEKALFRMHLNKSPSPSPSPDGFTLGFYIKHSDILHTHVCLLSVQEGGGWLNPLIVLFWYIFLRTSFVFVLIRKVKQHDLTQYRPIALCNVLYKIESKVIRCGYYLSWRK
jgi:hypothetical protein